MLKIVFLTILLVLAGLYWQRTWFAARFLAQLAFLNLPPHLQDWLAALFRHSQMSGSP